MSIFNKISLKRPKRTMHNLSYSSRLSADFGKLIPIMCEKVVPGDKFIHGHEFLLRTAPFVNQVFQGFQTRVDYYFVPSRLLWKNFEAFLSKGVNGSNEYVHPYLNLQEIYDGEHKYESTLLDYFNLATSNLRGNAIDGSAIPESMLYVDCLPFYALAKILLDYYFDENLYPSSLDQETLEILLSGDLSGLVKDGDCNEDLKVLLWILHLVQGRAVTVDSPWIDLLQPFMRSYPKDYFTSALPFAQRGPIVQIPLNGSGDVTVQAENRGLTYQGVGISFRGTPSGTTGEMVDVKMYAAGSDHGVLSDVNTVGDTTVLKYRGAFSGITERDTANQARIDMWEGNETPAIEFKAVNVNGTATITDLRTAMTVQAWLEKNARAGVRYKEQLFSHFGVRSRDYRLDRAQLLGSYKSTIQIGETFTTAANQDGSFIPGMGVSNATGSQAVKPWRHFFDEHGYVIGLFSVFPSAAYSQGIPKQFTELDVFDYYWPEFQNIGEQEIKRSELGIDDDSGANNGQTFGYTPRYAQYKSRYNQIHGDFRTSLQFMHSSRIFKNLPLLNNNFVNIDIDYNDLYRVFNADTELAESSPIYLDFFHNFKALRPMQYFGSPRII